MVNTLTNADINKNGMTISPNDSTVTSIKQLPDELLLHIFSFLQAFDLLEVELICHRWKNLANDETLWKNLYQKHFEIYGPDEGPFKESYFAAHWEKCLDEKTMTFLESLKQVERNVELAKYMGIGLP
ncbi:F-box protein [Neochlamydia sp. S13]|uniref:F-box protein n=1 Tax=Neochlamydia sp. S13 TaxID=1353976 RepID=UPI000FD173B6|nr:F-box protein [Neochlamydia sp. S13]BBI16251.1 AAEL004875-PA [Neochlamydia sp. S13]